MDKSTDDTKMGVLNEDEPKIFILMVWTTNMDRVEQTS